MTYQDPKEEHIATLMRDQGISGTVVEGGPPSTVYLPGGRVFTVTVVCGRQAETFAVYVGPYHDDIDLVFALRWLLETAIGAEEATYERWLAEGGDEYQDELGEPLARAIYENGHDVRKRLLALLGETASRALRKAIW